MEPIKGTELLLSNYEVLSLLQEIKTRSLGQQNLSTVCYEAIKYLKGTPCVQQNEEIIQKFTKEIAKFKLTTVEQLQLLNLRPTTESEMFVVIHFANFLFKLFDKQIISNCNERFSEEELTEILTVVSTYLPGPTVDGVLGEEDS